MKAISLLTVLLFVGCASKLPKSKELTVFADKIEISITEKGDGLKFRTLDGSELYRHSELKAPLLATYINKALTQEKKFKNNRRHKKDVKETYHQGSGVLLTFSYNNSNKTSILVLCFKPENKSHTDGPICEGMESWKAKRLLDSLNQWKSVKDQI